MIYQRILLPISGKHKGERALKALAHALKLVKDEIVLLHAYDPLPKIVGGEGHMELVREAKAEGLNIVAPLVDAIKKVGLISRVRVEEGPAMEAIVHVAHEEKCDLIVMFTDGREGVRDMLLGSVAERVLRHTDIPLLAIRR